MRYITDMKIIQRLKTALYPFHGPTLSTELEIEEKILYPATNGVAIIAEVLDKSEMDVLCAVQREGHVMLERPRTWYIPNEAVDAHAIRLDKLRGKVYIGQTDVDPSHDIMYVRYVWRATWVDRLYNWWCRRMGRLDSQWVRTTGAAELPAGRS